MVSAADTYIKQILEIGMLVIAHSSVVVVTKNDFKSIRETCNNFAGGICRMARISDI